MAHKRTRGGNLSRADWILQGLARDGLRMTGPRAEVVNAIADRSGAFTPEALVDELRPSGIGRATVYRALDLLEQRGMVARMHLDGCHGYTLCDEGHHHHLVCRRCGHVLSVDASEIEADILRLGEQLRFRVDTHTLEFSGLCDRCQADASATGAAQPS